MIGARRAALVDGGFRLASMNRKLRPRRFIAVGRSIPRFVDRHW
jgi:hypothetical protein